MKLPITCKLIFRFKNLTFNNEFEFNKALNWYFFNDFYNLNEKRIANIVYFHLNEKEFWQIEEIQNLFKNESKLKYILTKKDIMNTLSVQMFEFYKKSNDLKMKFVVSIFAFFVFLLPVILNSLV